MTMNPLPPQAYTKDILLKSYQWLMGQNTSLKEMATTPDILVSLYLKATRDGDHALERPSIQNFKNELRSLAGIMGELEGPPIPKVATLPGANVVTSGSQAPAGATAAAAPIPSAPSYTSAISHSNSPEKSSSAMLRKSDLLEHLDTASRTMIREVKEDLNLSSDIEALRMLIKIGYFRSRSLLT